MQFYENSPPILRALPQVNNFMKEPGQANQVLHRVWTNSLIKVEVTEECTQLGVISYKWSSVDSLRHKGTIDGLWSFPQEFGGDAYACTPLDYGKIIKVQIGLNTDEGRVVLDQLTYGPVELQEKLMGSSLLNSEWEGKQKYDVKFLFHKTAQESGEVRLLPHSTSPHEPLKILNFQFYISGKCFALTFSKESRLPPKGHFLKLYENQPSCLGISMFHCTSDFLKFMKNLKVSAHSGYYVKVQFKDHFERDLFICSLLKEIGVGMPKRQRFRSSSQIQMSSSMQETSQLGSMCPMKVSQTLSAFGKLSHGSPFTKISEISNQEEEDGDREHSARKGIIDDIYNILYTPLSNYRGGQSRRSQLYNNDFDFIRKSIINTVRVQEDEQLGDRSDSESGKTVKNDKKDYQNVLFQKKAGVLLFEEAGNEDFREHSEFYYKKKIEALCRMNDELHAKNKALTEENLRLRYENSNQANAVPDMGKMIEIKSMVQQMALRLEVLEKEKYGEDANGIKNNPKWLPNASNKRYLKDKSIASPNKASKLLMTFSPKATRIKEPFKKSERQLFKVRSKDSIIDLLPNARPERMQRSPSPVGEVKTANRLAQLMCPVQGRPSLGFDVQRSPTKINFNYKPQSPAALTQSTKMDIVHRNDIGKSNNSSHVVSFVSK